MALAILSFIVETIFLAILKACSDAKTLDRDFAIFSISVILVCTVTSSILIFYNARRIKDRTISKGVSITGLVFSIETAVAGLIFFIGFLFGLALVS